MKKNIHPKYYPKATITCACGASFVAGSTQKALHIEVCSSCHPFFTGKKKLIDTEGRVEKFEKRAKLAQEKQKVLRTREKARLAKEQADQVPEAPKSLKEMLKQVKKGL